MFKEMPLECWVKIEVAQSLSDELTKYIVGLFRVGGNYECCLQDVDEHLADDKYPDDHPLSLEIKRLRQKWGDTLTIKMERW